LPPLATDAREVSHLLGVLLPPMSTRPCFMPNPPIGFGVVRSFSTCSDLPKKAPPRARYFGCYPSVPCRQPYQRWGPCTTNSQKNTGVLGG
jgi:hypothetical protein